MTTRHDTTTSAFGTLSLTRGGSHALLHVRHVEGHRTRLSNFSSPKRPCFGRVTATSSPLSRNFRETRDARTSACLHVVSYTSYHVRRRHGLLCFQYFYLIRYLFSRLSSFILLSDNNLIIFIVLFDLLDLVSSN